jgi:putative membrane protein
VSGALVLLTGLARTFWGVKGVAWYWAQPLLHTKITLLVAMLALLVLAARQYRAWRHELDAQGSLPSPEALRRTRKLVMWSAHLMVVVALLAVFLARGVGTR